MTNPVLLVRKFRVEELRWESAEIYTLVLVPVDPAEMVQFKAGQWVYMHLFNPDGSMWARAAFSIATAPSESKEKIELTIKQHGDYTRRASQLQPDDVVGVQGPFGVFTLPESGEPLVFFAGGIGITPFRSMIRELYLRKDPRKVILFYSNRDHEETAFYEDFDEMNADWPSFKPIFTLTGQFIPAKWLHLRGRFTAEIIKAGVPQAPEGSYFICGPVTFMDSIKEQLASLGVDTKTQLHKELFGT